MQSVMVEAAGLAELFPAPQGEYQQPNTKFLAAVKNRADMIV